MLIAQRPTIEEVEKAKNNRQQFAISPLEPGFGHTLGNSLRRILLSSLGGAAITSVKFDGISHEFTTIPGIEEDVTDIILNLKDVAIKSHIEEPVVVSIDEKGLSRGSKVVTAAVFDTNPDIEVVNPDQPIATLNSNGHLVAEVTIDVGRGYTPAVSTSEASIGHIPVDAIFSPILRATFAVEATQVEQSTEYDRLVLDIQTDGTVTPKDALASAAATLKSLSELIEDMGDDPRGLEFVEAEEELPQELAHTADTLGLSERARHCLERADIFTVGDLISKTPKELLSIVNFGQVSLDEVIEKLDEVGLALAESNDEPKKEAAEPAMAEAEES